MDKKYIVREIGGKIIAVYDNEIGASNHVDYVWRRKRDGEILNPVYMAEELSELEVTHH